MESPKLPINELERIHALRSYELLDTEVEAEYDSLVKLASYICQTPIALMSLVDTDRQWFKSKKGLLTNQTSREISFCGHAVYEHRPLTVTDARLDDRFRDNPLVTGDPKIVFYSGVPLIDKEA